MLAALVAGLAEILVDLQAHTVTAGDCICGFEIEPVWRTKRLNGRDDVDLAQSYAQEMRSFSRRDGAIRAWAQPGERALPITSRRRPTPIRNAVVRCRGVGAVRPFVGYAMRSFGLPVSTLLLGLVLAPFLEQSF